ncbi:replication initiation protein [Aeromonas media]|uniref:replication initiation protein n=1 Tax=Aeromonas media TaxID=651 RepID=UPI00370A8AF6
MQVERIRAHLNDRHFLMVDHDESPTIHAHTLYDIEPNVVVYNQTNPNRHQAFWLLKDPVFCQPEVRERQPYRYLTAIEASYDDRYGADPCFARHIHRNPTAFINDTDWRHWRPHSLAELAEPIDLRSRREGRGEPISGEEGRNVALFHELRQWAYQQVLDARGMAYGSWHKLVVTRALAMSGHIVSDKGALDRREVAHVAASVARFVYYRYAGSGSNLTPELRELKAKMGAIGGRKSRGGGRPSGSGKARSELQPEVFRLKALGYSNRDISQDLGISASTVSLYLKREKE